jgi:hypothetical protein
MIGLAEAPFKARPDVVILAHLTNTTQRHVQWYLIGVANAPEGVTDFIANVQKMENRLILDGVDDDLGDKIIWQQLHQAHRGHQVEGEEIEKRRGLEFEMRREFKLATRVEVEEGASTI